MRLTVANLIFILLPSSVIPVSCFAKDGVDLPHSHTFQTISVISTSAAFTQTISASPVGMSMVGRLLELAKGCDLLVWSYELASKSRCVACCQYACVNAHMPMTGRCLPSSDAKATEMYMAGGSD